MLHANDIILPFGQRVLFEEANIKFRPGNCYGLIGANGSGKSTFLKILSGELEPNAGEVTKNPKERIAILRQDHFAFLMTALCLTLSSWSITNSIEDRETI